MDEGEVVDVLAPVMASLDGRRDLVGSRQGLIHDPINGVCWYEHVGDRDEHCNGFGCIEWLVFFPYVANQIPKNIEDNAFGRLLGAGEGEQGESTSP
jgi:hypothetical protein